jgi:hypothetical protein
MRRTVRAWFAKRPRYKTPFTPICSSGLNQFEIWFGVITRQAILRGSFRTVHGLIQRVTDRDTRYHHISRRGTSIVAAESILAKLTRFAEVVSGTHRQ